MKYKINDGYFSLVRHVAFSYDLEEELLNVRTCEVTEGNHTNTASRRAYIRCGVTSDDLS